MTKFVYLARVKTPRGWVAGCRPSTRIRAEQAARFLRALHGDEAVRVDEIHVCERDGCTAHTPYELCRRHDREQRQATLAALPVPASILKPEARRIDRRNAAAAARAIALPPILCRPPGTKPSLRRVGA